VVVEDIVFTEQNISKNETSNTMEVSAKRIISLDELLKQCNVDLTIWEVERYIANKWEMAEKGGNITPLFQIKATLKRRTMENLNWDFVGDTLCNKLLSHIPDYESIKRDFSKDSHLLIIDPSDAHFGKLVSSYENPGKTYNLQVAKERYIEGFLGIMEKAERHKIDKVLIVIGNDIMHTDNPRSTTTKGTYQDSDGMFYDMFNTALDATITVIESIMKKYDVDVVFNASNHDYSSSWMLARTLEAWFRNTSNVNVDSRITHRKYYQYGLNLIGTSHGDGAKLTDLPLHMANEAPELWSKTKFRYVYLHHIHHYNKVKFQTGKDYIGVTVEYLRSPSEADSWHFINGYTGSPKAIEGFIHHKDNGQVGKFTHYF
jgi:DNA repair exonuclease SbcCD nuclease subunit